MEPATQAGSGPRTPTFETAQRAVWSFVRTLAAAALAGLVAGVIAGGVGSRLAMRISAITTESKFRGILTEADQRVGEITVDGTVFLLVAGGILGVFGGLTYAAVRGWLADAGRWRGLAFGVLLLAMFGWALIEGDNKDFHLFGPPALNIAMFASLYIVFGLLVAPLFDAIQRLVATPSLTRRSGVILPADFSMSGLGSLAAHGVGLVLTAPIVGAVAAGFGEEGDNAAFFRLLPAYVLLVLPVAALLLARGGGRFGRLSDLRQQPWALGVALVVLALPVVVGLALTAQAITDIFEAAG